MIKKLLCLNIICVFFISNIFSQKYTIIETKTETSISLEDLVDHMAPADVILFGEEHNDAMAHQLQLDILEGLYYLTEGNLSLSMEMWERDVQPIMNEYLEGFISEKNFKKESRAWSNYDDYKPLIEFAKLKKLNVICANTPARYTNMVTRGTLKALNQLPASTRQKFLPPLPIDTLTGAYYEKFKEAMGGHLSPNMYLYQSQNLWDATMTHSIIERLRSEPFHKVLHINGRFHSDNNLGITYRIKGAPQNYKVITISCIQTDNYSPEDLTLADYIILTGSKDQ